MHNHPMTTPAPDDAQWDTRVLDWLVLEHQGLWSIDELRQLGGDGPAVDDALARLQALGLIHKVEDCVFATRAAAHMHQLAEAA